MRKFRAEFKYPCRSNADGGCFKRGCLQTPMARDVRAGSHAQSTQPTIHRPTLDLAYAEYIASTLEIGKHLSDGGGAQGKNTLQHSEGPRTPRLFAKCVGSTRTCSKSALSEQNVKTCRVFALCTRRGPPRTCSKSARSNATQIMAPQNPQAV